MLVGILSLFIIVTFGAYFLLMAQFALGWNKVEPFEVNSPTKVYNKLSCIIAFRNEENNLKNLITSLKKQDYPAYEVILVDDASTDSSLTLAKHLTQELGNFTVLSNNGEGKKSALATGVRKAKYDFLVFTDADCLIAESWLNRIANYLVVKDTDLLLGPVKHIEASTLFEKFQSYDFLSLIVCSVGGVGLNRPIMCNGANLTVKKDVWLDAQVNLNNDFASGDDIFLLQYCKSEGKTIDFLKSRGAMVKTYPEKNLQAFLQQRVRWASKSKGYTDVNALFVAWVVFLSNMFLFSAPVWILIEIKLAVMIFTLGMLKFCIDYLTLKQGEFFFETKVRIFDYARVAVLYPLYIITTVMWAMVGKTSWKKRRI